MSRLYLFALALIHLCAHINSNLSATARQGTEVELAGTHARFDDDLFIVTLLDGTIVAVDPETGKRLWEFDSGSPLVSARRSEETHMNVFPGVDGGLYAYYGYKGLERLPITLPDLVDASPSLADDGSVILGNRRSMLYLVDRNTGKLIRSISDFHGILDEDTSTGFAARGSVGSVLYFGRREYSVRSLRVDSGEETWNASFAKLMPLNPLQPTGSGSIRDFLVGDAALGDQLSDRVPSTRTLPYLTVAADNVLTAFDPSTSSRIWAERFDTPPVAAYNAAGSGENHLQPLTMPGLSSMPRNQLLPYGKKSVRDSSKMQTKLPTGTMVLVGALQGSLYALPADHLALEGSEVDTPPVQSGHKGNPSEFGDDTPVVVDDDSSGNLVPISPSQQDTWEDFSQLVCGVYNIRQSQQAVPKWLPALPGTADQPGRPAKDDPALRATGPGSLLLVILSTSVIMTSSFVWFVKWRQPVLQDPPPLDELDEDDTRDEVGGGKKSRLKKVRGIKGHHPMVLTEDGRLSHLTPLVHEYNGDLPASIASTRTAADWVSSTRSDGDMGDAKVYMTDAAGKVNGLINGMEKQSSSGDPGEGVQVSRSYVDENGSVYIGRLKVGPGTLGYGSAGTIVYEGSLDGRPVAVKRLLRQFYDLAKKEIDVLIVSDEHPNVVRCFAMEEDREFVYVALERCKMSLCDLLTHPDGLTQMLNEHGRPSAYAMQIMRDITEGLAALHQRGIVHRDLKPHNVLLTTSGRAKLSDMGLSKQLVAEQSSFESHGSGGSSGWQAPEQLIAKDGGTIRQTRSMDVFSLGCILYYCLTGGKHPFGENYERDANILKGVAQLRPLIDFPEALNLVASMLSKNADFRPSMAAVLHHPMWWSPERRLQFLVDVSDRVENEDREPDDSLLLALESYGQVAVGVNWGAVLDVDLVINLGKYRKYDYESLRDLLRVIRNKKNHFREMPPQLQQLMGPLPDGFLRYYTSRFPNLLMSVVIFALVNLLDEPNLVKYWPEDAVMAASFVRTFRHHHPLNNRVTLKVKGNKMLEGKAKSGVDKKVVEGLQDDAARANGNLTGALASRSQGSPNGVTAKSLKSRLMGEVDESSANCGDLGIVGYKVAPHPGVLHIQEFPRRPGEDVCAYYKNTGHCKFGDDCKYDHPEAFAVHLTEINLPYRPDQPICSYYSRNNHCKFGSSCKFHHPLLTPIYAGSVAVGGAGDQEVGEGEVEATKNN